MTTTVTQILNQIDVILKAHVPGGTNVYRDRADADSRSETPNINVLALEDTIEPFSAEMDRHELMVDLRINVRDPVPTPLAELQHAAVHTFIVTDATLQNLCVSIRQLAVGWERAEADQTSLIKTVKYRFIYLINETTL